VTVVDEVGERWKMRGYGLRLAFYLFMRTQPPAGPCEAVRADHGQHDRRQVHPFTRVIFLGHTTSASPQRKKRLTKKVLCT
jgi:hypothetical protein